MQLTVTFDVPGGGKTTANKDAVKGRFLQLHKDRRVRQAFLFDFDDLGLAGTMTMIGELVRLVPVLRGLGIDVQRHGER